MSDGTRAYRLLTADVFTDRVFEGNPLAILPDARGLSGASMQKIAAEMNLSETAFVLPPEDPRAIRKLRIFTPAAELPLAGHPVVGTFFVLASRGELGDLGDGDHRIHQECGAGVLPVDVRVRDGRVEQVVMTQAPPQFLAASRDRDALAASLGLDPADVLPENLPARVVSTALPQLMAPVRSLGAVGRIRVDAGALARLLGPLGSECVMAFSTECAHEESAAHARMFAPGLGVHEDPATGSAAGALGAYLVRYGLAKGDRMTVEQGYEMGRPSAIGVEVECENGDPRRVLVGGRAVEVSEGLIRVPA